MPHTMPVTLTVGTTTAPVGEITANADTWRESLAGLLRSIADEIGRPPITKLSYCMPTATGTCEHCGQAIHYNLTIGYVEHVEPQPDCAAPFPAAPDTGSDATPTD